MTRNSYAQNFFEMIWYSHFLLIKFNKKWPYQVISIEHTLVALYFLRLMVILPMYMPAVYFYKINKVHVQLNLFFFFMGIFKVRKFGMGFLWGLIFGPANFWGFDFCPLAIIPITWDPKYPLGSRKLNLNPFAPQNFAQKCILNLSSFLVTVML